MGGGWGGCTWEWREGGEEEGDEESSWAISARRAGRRPSSLAPRRRRRRAAEAEVLRRRSNIPPGWRGRQIGPSQIGRGSSLVKTSGRILVRSVRSRTEIDRGQIRRERLALAALPSTLTMWDIIPYKKNVTYYKLFKNMFPQLIFLKRLH
jgi:hypothetical protein